MGWHVRRVVGQGCRRRFVPGQVIEFDPATTAGAALQAAIGAGNLRAWVDGQDDVGPCSIRLTVWLGA
jgi:hypothetical protein